jgi:dehydrogenase/reductase SDR family protein 7B
VSGFFYLRTKKMIREKTIWITGASSGIGRALAIQLARENKLILSSRNLDELEVTKSRCASSKVHLELLDLADFDSHHSIVARIIKNHGAIDHLIHCGGISQRSLVKDTLLSVDEKLIRINYLGTVSLTKAILPHFLKEKQGHFTVITSLTGVFASPYRSGYAASKHALHGFFDSLRAELEDQGILVTLAAPGFVKTKVSINALTGDGNSLGSMDDAQAKGISAEACAQKTIRAIARNKREVYIGRESYAAYVKRYLPGVFARLIKKAKVR